MKTTLLQPVSEAAHRALFFCEPGLRVAWPTVAWFMRTRPFLTVLDRLEGLEGDVVECGVFWGRSLIPMAGALRKRGMADRKVFGLDSFNGFEEADLGEGDLGEGRTMETLRRRFKQQPRIVSDLRRVAGVLGLNVEIMPGEFSKTLPKIMDRTFCFVHLDCDIYQSYRTCLEALYPRVVPGGIILFDEYRSPVWPGATEAVDEFFSDKPEKPEPVEDPRRPGHPKFLVCKAAES